MAAVVRGALVLTSNFSLFFFFLASQRVRGERERGDGDESEKSS